MLCLGNLELPIIIITIGIHIRCHELEFWHMADP